MTASGPRGMRTKTSGGRRMLTDVKKKKKKMKVHQCLLPNLNKVSFYSPFSGQCFLSVSESNCHVIYSFRIHYNAK